MKRIRGLEALAGAALMVGTLVMPSAAVAAPVNVDEFNASYMRTLDASGLITPGTTVTYAQVEDTIGRWWSTTVNPDGSLISTAGTPGTLSQVKCIRPDRCWRRASYRYDDGKWHLISRGSVTYTPLRSFFAPVDPDDMCPPGVECVSTFDVDAVTAVGGVFTNTLTNSDASLSMVVTQTFAGPHYTAAIADTVDSVSTPLTSFTIDAAVQPTPVKAPPKSKIGAPAPAHDTAFTVYTN